MLMQWIFSLDNQQLIMLFIVGVCSILLFSLAWLFAVKNNKNITAQYKQLHLAYQALTIKEKSQNLDIHRLEDVQQTLEASLEKMRNDAYELGIDNARHIEKLNHLTEKMVDKSEFKQQQQKELENQFSVLAQKIFEEKTQQVEKNQNINLENSLKPFKEQLGSFQKRVEELYDKDLRDRLSLSGEINHLKKLNMQMSGDAVRLTQALRGQNKIQGNWGEMILEQVLEDSGLRKGHEYETQAARKNEEGQRLVPDIIVHLPNDKDIVIDSKVSLLSYERYISAETDDERDTACKEYITSLRKHLNDLNSKAYERMVGVRTLDFVFLFVPIEAAFLLALEHDSDLFRTAFNKQVVLVSPTTLFACLRTVEHLWRYERQNQHAEAIANQAAGLHDKLVTFSESLMSIGQSLNKASELHTQAVNQFSVGRGNVINRVRKLRELGAPAKKKFTQSLINNSDNEVDNTPPSQLNELEEESE